MERGETQFTTPSEAAESAAQTYVNSYSFSSSGAAEGPALSDQNLPNLALENASQHTPSWVERLLEFLSRLGGSKKRTRGEFDELWLYFFAGLFVFCVLVLLFFLARALWLLYKNRSPATRYTIKPGGESFERVEEPELEHALLGRDYSLAARIRWRIFQKEALHGATLTPFEWCAQRTSSLENERGLSSAYRLMFGSDNNRGDSASAAYTAFASWLAEEKTAGNQ